MPLLFDTPWLTLLAGAALIGLAFGAIAAATRYCNMGAVSDWVLTGDPGRMRAWLLSIAVAILGVALLETGGVFDLDQTRVNYRAADFPWLRYLLGGLLFGVGMVLAGGCTTKTLVNIGQGDMKSLWAYAVVGVTAAGLLYWPEARWFVDQTLAWPHFSFEAISIGHQDLGALLAGITPGGSLEHWRLAIALVVTVGLLAWLWRMDHGQRMRRADVIGGLGIGLVITAGWLWTGSPMGQVLMSEAALAFDPPKGTGTQSLSFVAPAAEVLRLAESPALGLVTFGIVAMLGVIVGAGMWAVVRGHFRLQGFRAWSQFGTYSIGGLLMGTGGIIAMGCSVGQGLSGASTLALGSLIALGGIVLGAFVTLKIMLYRALYPESRRRSLTCALLADLRLIPRRCHPFRDEDPTGERPSGCSR
ncbi:YeeE/YedE family protein [Guyparkeria hydrothermalis]|uniref:YeeE/YedE family protein n=1 Tax=Guyparkeria TaxID=2035712 RepID=UPI0010AD43D6|nr:MULTISPECIES: YeeE/YedE family protein [Guyparkeria]MCL7750078.1 YeeE/YedE family protein [Guyparkeria hydrothermalis]TKA88819.1 YeeE/YedE family protein [Guyparkeria sp. SB14A]